MCFTPLTLLFIVYFLSLPSFCFSFFFSFFNMDPALVSFLYSQCIIIIYIFNIYNDWINVFISGRRTMGFRLRSVFFSVSSFSSSYPVPFLLDRKTLYACFSTHAHMHTTLHGYYSMCMPLHILRSKACKIEKKREIKIVFWARIRTTDLPRGCQRW